MAEEGGTAEGADAGAGGEGTGEGESTGRATDDGTGGKASMLDGGDAGGDKGGEGESSGDTGKLDMKALLGEELSADRNISKFLESENPVQELAKSLVEAQKQVGTPKPGVPGEQATDAERAEFNKAMGVPDKGDASEEGYNFTKPEGLPDEAYNEEHANKWASLMKENNVPKDVANTLRTAMFNEMVESAIEANAELNKQLETAFGDKKDLIAKEVGALMKEAVPDQKLRETIQNSLDDKQTPAFALALGNVLTHMKQKYGLTDINIGGEGDSTSGKTLPEMRAEGATLMASEPYTNAMHKDHAETVKTVNALYKEIGLLTDQEKKK